MGVFIPGKWAPCERVQFNLGQDLVVGIVKCDSDAKLALLSQQAFSNIKTIIIGGVFIAALKETLQGINPEDLTPCFFATNNTFFECSGYNPDDIYLVGNNGEIEKNFF